ncbi:hypothetical protein [Demetria terragena]|uniref:hypothetical protein n=1 Tax=Demetria terragena TaxID=63959 RepID=UPI0003719171|nr:hypothetical protein [Demetria terragena]
MGVIGWVALIVAVLSLIAWRLTYAAARLDRLHGRVEGTVAALDAQLVRRAEAALELARCEELDNVSALVLGGAATASLELADEEAVATEVREHGIAPEREDAENQLTEALRHVLSREVVSELRTRDAIGAECLGIVRNASTRVQLSRRFYNDAARDVRKVRSKRLVRWFRLAGHTELPRTIEFDDGLPDALG